MHNSLPPTQTPLVVIFFLSTAASLFFLGRLFSTFAQHPVIRPTHFAGHFPNQPPSLTPTSHGY